MNYRFYYPDWNSRENICEDYPEIKEITKEPIFGMEFQTNHQKDQTFYSKITKSAHPYLPVLVIYSIPNRDLGHHSKGGADSIDEYLEFIQGFCDSLGDKSPIVIYSLIVFPIWKTWE